MAMQHDTFRQFDNACIGGDLSTIRAILMAKRPSGDQLNTALRHAAYYSGPNGDTREEVIDELLEHGATVDWDDRGIETIVNAIRPRNAYLLKRILNACDGNEEKLCIALTKIRSKDGSEWAARLVEARMLDILHIGL